MNKRWNLLYKNIDPALVAEIARAANLSPLLSLLLAVRGVSPENASSFITGGLATLHDPFLLADMDKAVPRIQKAIAEGERITVYGDYDVDGISATAMLVSYLQKEGANCSFYIPDRETEGYGLSSAALEKLRQEGTTLLITVDTGITACAEAELANALGMDLIITDHHSIGETLPKAYAVINPKREDCPYPYKMLAGAGVAFKLLCALSGDAREMVLAYCDIAALATIADVVPLDGENRVLTNLGLRKMRKLPSVGISALCEAAGIESAALSSYAVSFAIAPRLNAAGRMGSCIPAVQLLLTDSLEEAAEIAQNLDAQNTARKAFGDSIYEEAMAAIESGDFEDKKVIVLAHPGWHHGIIGITASKITEHFFKPTILISTDGDTGKGSGRSIPGLNLHEALSAADALLDKYGGHALAAGLTLPAENIPALSEALNAYADKVLSPEDLLPILSIDAPLDISLPLLSVVAELDKLEPYGAANGKPVFLIEGVTISSVRTSKDGKHLFLRLFKNGSAVDCVAFGKGNLAENLQRADIVDIAAELHINTYGGAKTPQLILCDLRAHEEKPSCKED